MPRKPFVVLTPVLAFAPAVRGGDAKKDGATLQGTWLPSAVELEASRSRRGPRDHQARRQGRQMHGDRRQTGRSGDREPAVIQFAAGQRLVDRPVGCRKGG